MTTLNDILLCNNFAGIRRINSEFSSSFISASDLQNVELFNTGINSGVGIRTMKGNRSVFEFADENEKIINIYQSVQNSEKYCFLHTENQTEGRIYLYNPLSGTVTLKVSALTKTGVSCGVDFAQGWTDLFLFSNGEEMLSIQLGRLNTNLELDEVTIFSPTDMENRAVKGLGMVVFDGRLWIFNGSVLWYSVKENCYDFSTSSADITTSSGYIEFVKKITTVYPYLGTLAIFHKDSSCLLSINSDYTYSVSDESPGGCAGVNSIVFHGTQLYFYDDTKKSVFAFSQIINGDKTLSENLAKDVQEELFSITSNSYNKIKMLSVIQPERNEIWMLLPSNSADTSDILIFDYMHSEWVKRKSQKLNTIAIVNDVFYSASANKLLIEYSGNNFDGTFIQSYYICSPLNLSVDNTMKILYVPPRVTLDIESNNNFMVQYTKNYDNIKQVKVKNITQKNIKNVFYWDKSYWNIDTVFKPRNTNSVKRLPTASFKTLEIKFYTNTASGEFAIKNIEFSKIKVKQI